MVSPGVVDDNEDIVCPTQTDSTRSDEPFDDENHLPWTTVYRRRARGPKGVEHATTNDPVAFREPVDTAHHDPTVLQAAEDLTPEKRDKISRRYEKITKPARRPRAPSVLHSVSSRGEGPSRPKAKGIDPRNWGNADIPDAFTTISKNHKERPTLFSPAHRI